MRGISWIVDKKLEGEEKSFNLQKTIKTKWFAFFHFLFRHCISQSFHSHVFPVRCSSTSLLWFLTFHMCLFKKINRFVFILQQIEQWFLFYFFNTQKRKKPKRLSETLLLLLLGCLNISWCLIMYHVFKSSRFNTTLSNSKKLSSCTIIWHKQKVALQCICFIHFIYSVPKICYYILFFGNSAFCGSIKKS